MCGDNEGPDRDFVKEWIGDWKPEDGPERLRQEVDDLRATDFEAASPTSDWRNYVGDGVRVLWPTFNDQQRAAIAMFADEMAGREDWT